MPVVGPVSGPDSPETVYWYLYLGMKMLLFGAYNTIGFQFSASTRVTEEFHINFMK